MKRFTFIALLALLLRVPGATAQTEVSDLSPYFECSTADAPKWYHISIGGSTAANLCHQDDATDGDKIAGLYGPSRITSYDRMKGFFWAFVKDGETNHVKLLNMQTNKYIYLPSDATAVTSSTTSSNVATTYFKLTSDASHATAFTVVQSTYSTGTGNKFSLKANNAPSGITNPYLAFYWYKNKQSFLTWLNCWDDANAYTDQICCFTAIRAQSGDDFFTKGKACASTSVALPTEDNLLTAYDVTDLQAAKTAAESATTAEDFDTAYKKFSTAYNEYSPTLSTATSPKYDTSAYYRIRTVNKNALANYGYFSTETSTVSTDGTTTTACAVYRGQKTGAVTPQLWRIEDYGAEDGTVKLVNANTGQPIAQVTGTETLTTCTEGGTAGKVKIETRPGVTLNTSNFVANDKVSVFLLKIDDHNINAYKGASANSISDWSGNSESDGGNYWQFEKVTEVTVTVSESAGWASVCMPFAVTLPESTEAKAYKATSAGNGTMKLTELSGTVPAKTGFLLCKDGGGDVTLSISTETGADVGENKLSGATAKRAGFNGGDNYFLALNSAGKAAFLQSGSSLTTVPCNKAYLPATQIDNTASTSSATLDFDFDGGKTTGIDNAAQSAESRAVKYYDLSGRRVLFPANGVFVTDKGEKVLLR